MGSDGLGIGVPSTISGGVYTSNTRTKIGTTKRNIRTRVSTEWPRIITKLRLRLRL